MTNKLFLICLLIGLVCAYCEYYWMQHGYRSLVIIASKCPKPSSLRSISSSFIPNSQSNNQTINTIQSIFNWFSKIFHSTKDKQILPTICETFEIHFDPRSIFFLIKTCCLISLTFKLISSLKTLPILIRTRQTTIKQSNEISSISKGGDGIIQQSKLFQTTIDKRNPSIR